jgi:hypothetical protein
LSSNLTLPGQNLESKAEGYNAGFQAAADRFELWILILAGLFLVKVLIKAPPIQNRISDWKGYEYVETIEFSADVLAFFIVVVMAWVASGKPLYTIN